MREGRVELGFGRGCWRGGWRLGKIVFCWREEVGGGLVIDDRRVFASIPLYILVWRYMTLAVKKGVDCGRLVIPYVVLGTRSLPVCFTNRHTPTDVGPTCAFLDPKKNYVVG
jgi:hypothetical protein